MASSFKWVGAQWHINNTFCHDLGPVFLLGERKKKKRFYCYYSCRPFCFFNGLWWCLFLCFSWKEMWLQDYWQSLDQGEALTAMIHRNESHQGRFWDYMHEIFLKRTRQHWPIFIRAWSENCIESWDWEFLLHSKCLPWSRRKASCRHFFWCMKWVVLCCRWISSLEMWATAFIWISALWCEGALEVKVST